MRLSGKIRTMVIAECIFVMLLIGLLEWSGYPVWVLAAMFFIQAGIGFAIMTVIILPVKSFEDTMKRLIGEEGTEEELQKAAKESAHMAQVERLVDKYASRRTRENSAQIFDKQTELTALQSQINPHFLYNTLESIRGQALMDDNYEIAKMVEALGAFFRYSISRKGNLVTLRDELANIHNYMLIQRYRFNNRFSLEIIIDEEDEAAYDFLIPRLIIQPVVENAIFHGLEERLEAGKVMIEVIVTEKNLILTISDNGKGIDSGKLRELNARIQSSNMQLEEGGTGQQRNTGIALPNIHKRIQLLFGEEYGVNIYSTAGQGTDVEITIPVINERVSGLENEERNIAD